MLFSCELHNLSLVVGFKLGALPCVLLVLLLYYPCRRCRIDASPDSSFLLVSWLNKPFSTSVPAGRFPVELQVRWRFLLGLWSNANGS